MRHSRLWSLIFVVVVLAMACSPGAASSQQTEETPEETAASRPSDSSTTSAVDESGGEAPSGGSSDAITDASGVVGVLLQSTAASARWETQDRPRLEEALARFAPNAELFYANAEGLADNQLRQAEAAVAEGAEVLLVAPVDGVAAGEIARKAAAADVEVIAYDALILEAPVDYYVSFDNIRVGELMGEHIVEMTDEGDTVVMIGGSPQDNNAILFEEGALNVLQPHFDSGEQVLGYRTLTPEWKLENAQREMEQALSQLGNEVHGVVAGNDNLATGVIAAIRAQGLAGQVALTGQDATAAGLAQIADGTQTMTVYKPIALEAEAAARLAAHLLDGQELPPGVVNGEVDNGSGPVPSVLLDPISVTRDNIDDTVIADGFVTWDDICEQASSTCPPSS